MGLRLRWIIVFVLVTVTQLCHTAAFATYGEDRSFKIEAEDIPTSPAIRISWLTVPAGNDIQVYRKGKDETSWGSSVKTLPSTATEYIDESVVVGETYEYRLYQPGTYPRYGYVYAGIEAPLLDDRGKLLLLVDGTKVPALDSEITRLEEDLIGDGWEVSRHDIPTTATVPDVKNLIIDAYTSESLRTKSVFLFGRIPVPYSGNIAPDGHGNHVGAWPADNFYGDIDGSWTDTVTNNTSASRTANHNVPGDGKYDQSSFPSAVELMVGRVDLSNMPAFALDETELLRQYLDKNHAFRHVQISPPVRALVKEGFASYSEGFDQNGWRLTSLVGKNNAAFGAWADLITNEYLFAFGSGPGSYTSAGGLTNTAGYAANTYQAMFTLFLGSYFGDWDSTNNFLRAPLCNPDWGLAAAWAGRPNWHLHHMALGEPIGLASRLATTNTIYSGGYAAGQIHVGLMGDPTLRIHYFDTPSTLTLTYNEEALEVNLDWEPSPAPDVSAYHIYRSANRLGKYDRITTTPMTMTSATDTIYTPGEQHYMVRAVRLEQSTGGSFWNASQGIRSSIALSGPPEIDGPATLDCGLASTNGGYQSSEYTIENKGPLPLYFSSPAFEISGPNAAEFTITYPSTPGPVPPGGVAYTGIDFTPTGAGIRSAVLYIYTNDPVNPVWEVGLTGEGSPPEGVEEWWAIH